MYDARESRPVAALGPAAAGAGGSTSLTLGLAFIAVAGTALSPALSALLQTWLRRRTGRGERTRSALIQLQEATQHAKEAGIKHQSLLPTIDDDVQAAMASAFARVQLLEGMVLDANVRQHCRAWREYAAKFYRNDPATTADRESHLWTELGNCVGEVYRAVKG
jgi:hypothetical protein